MFEPLTLTRTSSAKAVPSMNNGSGPASTDASSLKICSPLPSSAPKNSVPLTSVSACGADPASPGRRSMTRTVPAAVPSLRHNSGPLMPSSAVK
jgi:hypothetical protein